MASNTYECSECKYLNEQFDDKWVCTKHNKETSGNGCDDFDKLKFCDTCKYAKVLVYETGEIDSIDYRCILQINKVVYSDTNPTRINNAKYPECILDMYEENK